MSSYRHNVDYRHVPPGLTKDGCSSLAARAGQVYDDDGAFIHDLTEFVGAALGSGGSCIVIATHLHHRNLNRRLRHNSIDVRRISSAGRYVALDARETLCRFMVDGHPDPQRFCGVIEPVLQQAKNVLRNENSTICVFAEMVALLWADGNRTAAIELEHLWDDLARRHRLTLRCVYPVSNFADQAHPVAFGEISSSPSESIPAQRTAAPGSEEERMLMVSALQQKESTVQAVVEDREREVAQRKVVEEKLRRTEEFTRNIIESTIDCVKVLDLEGRVQYLSPPGQRALGITDPEQFLNKDWTDFWRTEDKSRAEDALSAARSGGVGCFQADMVTPGGAKKTWDVRITPALDRHGEIERLVAVSRDITELRHAQQIAIQAEKLAAAGRMAATIAHEINNPLEAVTNFIYLAMTAQGLPEEVCQHLKIADRELARVAQIAQQTLGFYRDNSKDRWIAVADLMRDVMIVYERKIAYKQLETEIVVQPNLKLYCKQGELRQALSNLVANAIDASKPGGKLWLRAHRATRWNDGGEAGVRITLADNGVGMSRDVQKRIFVPFFTTKAESGTGIGLWATRSLIEQQGGSMHFRSRQGQRSGTVMSLFLPHAHPKPTHN